MLLALAVSARVATTSPRCQLSRPNSVLLSMDHRDYYSPTTPRTRESSQAESGVCGVGPAESTGKPPSRYCPGGSLPLMSLGFRRPRNPRAINPSLIVSPPAPLSLCSYCVFVYRAPLTSSQGTWRKMDPSSP